MSDDLKKLAAQEALDFVRPGMKLGLGTGSTATHFVSLLGERIREGLSVRCVATSRVTEDHAAACGVAIEDLNDLVSLDLTVDGTDEIDPRFRLIKGGGGALLREKIVAASSERMLVIADGSKRVETLGQFRLPIEIVSFGHGSTMHRIRRLLEAADRAVPLEIRRGADGTPFRTDNGNLIVDAALGRIDDPDALEVALNGIPGVVESGLFIGLATDALIASADGVTALAQN